jgi:hypothetical protein
MRRLVFLVTLLWAGAGGTAPAEEPSPPAPRLEKPLLAHWSFDEPPGLVRDVSGAGRHARLGPALETVRGVHGQALHLRGQHALQVRGVSPGRELAGLAFSVWVRPTDLSAFREIFRQECGNRVLFSFQENGTILSLGLNVGGYVECDAPIQPEAVRDGQWHHCAAAFDGEVMRVYLDGREAGSLARRGTVALQTEAPAFLGSLSGTSEHFQGGLDDLRIYAAALTAEEVAALHKAGAEAQRRRAQELEAGLRAVLETGPSFAGTLAATRRRLAARGEGLDADLLHALEAKLRAAFPTECHQFREWTGVSVAHYVTTPDAKLDTQLASRLTDLLLEYKPLTGQQWQRQPPGAREQWAEADRIKQRCDDLQARGEAARFSPEWVALMLEAGARIQFRPRVHEPVAPYVKPETPATRDRSAAEARALLEADWLHQADHKPTPERTRDELRWTRELAARLQSDATRAVDLNDELAALDRLEAETAALAQPDRELYFKVRELKRRVMFKNPVVDFDQVLFVDMPFPQGSEWQHETRHRLGYMAVPGGRLLTLEGLRPDGRLRQLMPRPPLHGSFWRPDLSYDGQRVLFCFKPHNEKSFHLYEIRLDGSGLRQLTDGPFDDLDPIYLPDDGHLLFTTTRGHTYVRCMPPTSAFVLARCDRDGRDIYLISANNEPDYLPSVMPDGRILYTRWEYTDKPVWRMQKLWTINPDGTQVNTFWGNQSVWPDLVKDARVIPGSRRVMITGSAHHDWFAGAVGILDRDRGLNFPHGLTKVTADLPWPECGNGPVDPIESPRYHPSGRYTAYYSPYPLGERDFLVSAQRAGKFVLYLMDVDGNRELIYEGAHHVLHALPVKPRPKPPVLEDRVAWPGRAAPPTGGVLFSRNVHEGAPEELRGRARFLRVLSIDHKTYTYWYKRPYVSTGPVVSAVQSEGVKRVLGTVPVGADGSVSFHAPAGMPLHFQLLDERQRALQTMRSFVNVMPGEYRGCLGCHEAHSRAADHPPSAPPMSRPPDAITPPPWGEDTVSYPRYVQPVLDRYCGKCHQGDGEARKVLDLTERPAAPVFTEPYLTLIGRPTWGAPYVAPAQPPPGFGIAGMLMVEGYGQLDPRAYQTPPPMTALSYRSKLIELASSGRHHDVRVDDESLLRLILWVDTMCPYRGDDEVRQIPDPVFQGVDWLAVRPRIATAPRGLRPGPVD